LVPSLTEHSALFYILTAFAASGILLWHSWAEVIAAFPFIRHGPQRRQRRRAVIVVYVSNNCSGNAVTEPSYSNVTWIHIQTDRLIGGIKKLAAVMGSERQQQARHSSRPWLRLLPVAFSCRSAECFLFGESASFPEAVAITATNTAALKTLQHTENVT
jgi:hypothetical protein